MMGFLGAGNNPMVGMTVAVAVAVAEAANKEVAGEKKKATAADYIFLFGLSLAVSAICNNQSD